jgi:hypothetical protein
MDAAALSVAVSRIDKVDLRRQVFPTPLIGTPVDMFAQAVEFTTGKGLNGYEDISSQ